MRRSWRLRPLRIPGGWTVVWNTFSEWEPGELSREEACIELGEDLLLIRCATWAIDVGWYGDRATGRYAVEVVSVVAGKADYGGKSFATLFSRSTREVADEVERLLGLSRKPT